MIGPSGELGVSTRSKIGCSSRIRNASRHAHQRGQDHPRQPFQRVGQPIAQQAQEVLHLDRPASRALGVNSCCKLAVGTHPSIVSGSSIIGLLPRLLAEDKTQFSQVPRSGIAQSDCYHCEVISRADQAALERIRTVFLDRDGVLNEKMPEGQYVTRWAEFHVLAGVPDAVRRLNDAGMRVIVVSNQRGIARGLYTLADVEAIQSAFQHQLNAHGAHIDAFFICPHDIDQCNCRKPLPGLFEQAVAQFPEITAATSVMIGDSLWISNSAAASA